LSTSPAVIDELHAIDTKMIVELMNTPGILSYSSLELRDGNWCNLVLLSDLDAKIHVKNSDTHKYAAYDLAPHYYEWIRLHNGVIPDGIGSNRLIQYKVRHYLFHGDDGRPLIREQRYNNM